MPPNEFGNYSTTDNCRQYRECNGTQVYTDKCCPLGQKFDKARLTCVNDVTCLDKCGDDGRSFCKISFVVKVLTFELCYNIRSGPALGGAGPNWVHFRSAHVTIQLEPRSV